MPATTIDVQGSRCLAWRHMVPHPIRNFHRQPGPATGKAAAVAWMNLFQIGSDYPVLSLLAAPRAVAHFDTAALFPETVPASSRA